MVTFDMEVFVDKLLDESVLAAVLATLETEGVSTQISCSFLEKPKK